MSKVVLIHGVLACLSSIAPQQRHTVGLKIAPVLFQLFKLAGDKPSCPSFGSCFHNVRGGGFNDLQKSTLSCTLFILSAGTTKSIIDRLRPTEAKQGRVLKCRLRNGRMRMQTEFRPLDTMLCIGKQFQNSLRISQSGRTAVMEVN